MTVTKAPAVSSSELLEVLRHRYATKAFDPSRPIAADTWSALEQALVLTPSSYGLQPWKFLVITNPELRAELRQHSWNQSQITEASHLVVFLAQRTIEAADVERLINATSAARGLPTESLDFYRDLILKDLVNGPRSAVINNWAVNQVYIALGNFLTSAALLGVDTTPIEGFSPTDYDRVLGLEGTPYHSAVVAVAGYRSGDDKYAALAKVRYSANELIQHIG
ncbi:NAD(P)H-dependent oxidoreductase [Cyanobium sp. Morenito 9A2]|uniref:NAD(P)H-dependent oxidoreductase n=1 Tax=Cyanobium sp. Morenito 9A2 TaxID=2823718 RepID=UPI0020CFB975|nr:NAD(P)H-dependent oxidoreductase [Cyanobium sp. Morenito 9A2]MCP9848341.1 NAD(P)H-dependent oxidoreductase [Cyanobium sp. Morenito 9A2]